MRYRSRGVGGKSLAGEEENRVAGVALGDPATPAAAMGGLSMTVHATGQPGVRGWLGAGALGWACLAAPGFVAAADWSSANVQLLYSDGFADDFGIDDRDKAVFTLEYANGWTYGDNFFFLDVSNPTASGTAHYGEFSPRLSLARVTGKDVSFPGVKDVLFSTNFELGEDVHAYLAGIALALDLPGFAFADVTLYWRESHRDFVARDTDPGAQVTVAWLYPFQLGGLKFAFEGFADYAWGEDGGSAPKEDNLVAAPRLLLDVGDLWGSPGQLQAGIEYQVWRNKFGIAGVDEDAPQIMVKWTF